MEVAAIIEEFNAWKDSVAGRNGRCAIVDDWLKRRKLKRTAIANVIGVAPDTFELLCYLDEPTKDYDEFAKLLRQREVISKDTNISRFHCMVENFKGEGGSYSKAHSWVNGSKLIRKKIIEHFGIGKKAITGKRPEDPELARMFNRFENELRKPEQAILPPIDGDSKAKSEDKNPVKFESRPSH
ncbi:hypothetical protein [Vibrio sp. HN007]|uniref:hypothetical protein n=1 Tax=Vibrio iocasae TaxID=3098914 RepID=UPI0035D50BBC